MPGRAPTVVIVGGGTMGLASAWKLAERGAAVTVVESHTVPHTHGSHSGATRVIRQAYHEGTGYVPLVQEADAQWCALEPEPGACLVRTGMLEFGPSTHHEFLAALEACRVHGLEHTVLDAGELRCGYGVDVPASWRGCTTTSGGYLRVGACLSAMRGRAARAGATFRRGRVVAVEPGVARLAGGEAVHGDVMVVAAGTGAAELGVEMPPLVRVRRVMFWLRTHTDDPLRRLPVWGGLVEGGFFYGFPEGADELGGVKIACHTSGAIENLDAAIDPARLDRQRRPQDWAPVARFLARHLPGWEREVVTHRTCMYTVTPSRDFLVDRHPDDERLVVAAGFSGHGFKFAPAIGRLVADLVDGGATIPSFSWASHQRVERYTPAHGRDPARRGG